MMYLCPECNGVVINGRPHECPPVVPCTACGQPTYQHKSGRCLACILTGYGSPERAGRASRMARALEQEAMRQELARRERTPVPDVFYKAFEDEPSF